MTETWIFPDWPAPPQVHAAITTRHGTGISAPPFERFNLGLRSGRSMAIRSRPIAVRLQQAVAVASYAALVAPGAWHQRGRVGASTQSGRAAGGCGGVAYPRHGAVDPHRRLPAGAVLRRGWQRDRCCACWLAWPCRWRAGGDADPAGSIARTLLAWLGPCIGAASYEVVKMYVVLSSGPIQRLHASCRPVGSLVVRSGGPCNASDSHHRRDTDLRWQFRHTCRPALLFVSPRWWQHPGGFASLIRLEQR